MGCWTGHGFGIGVGTDVGDASVVDDEGFCHGVVVVNGVDVAVEIDRVAAAGCCGRG